MSTSLQHTVIFAMLLVVLWGCPGMQNKKQNRLQFASSPYLQEHADNPVDWYEWGEEALAKAKKENKPLLISVGYASCHWCHEMEKESFMDTAVARVMNEKFVCIKVDREERPDIDQVYMHALQLISGDAGWPLNAFALPDGKPFFAGTYYDKKSWTSLLNSISKAFVSKHTLVVTQANALVNGIAEQDLFLQDSAKPERSIVSKAVLENGIYSQADLIHGGFKGAQKFPTPVFIDFLLQHYYLTKDRKTLALADTTLMKMALGGIYDQVGGGFARYATDSLWRVPHFEKMLYDNGQMISVYAHAYQLTNNEFYKEKLTEIIRFVETKLAAPGGGYYSSLNADTEAGEGMYYAWKRNDFASITGNDKRIADYYQLTGKGNWKPGYNILYAALSPSAFASSQGMSPAVFKSQLNEARTRLLKERDKRAAPSTDTKIITAWNCIMIKGYADAYAATGNQGYLEKAKSCAVFIEKNMTESDGSLKRNFKDGKALIEGFLDDYAWAVAAMIRLYEVCFDMHWVDLAKKITGYAIRNFYNEKTGLFFYSGNGSSLVLRQTEVSDDALPSSNALMAKNLYLLGKLYDDTTYAAKVMVMKSAVTDRVIRMPRYHLQWCSLFELLSARSYEIAISGKDALLKNSELQRSFLPTSIVMGSTGAGTLPLLKDKFVEGKTVIYVCTDKMCKRPESETTRAVAQIK